MLGRTPGAIRQVAPAVTLWTDGGGKGPATSLLPVHGRETVADLLITVAANVPAGSTVAYRNINGDPSAIRFTGDSPFAVMASTSTARTAPASTRSPSRTNSPGYDGTGSPAVRGSRSLVAAAGQRRSKRSSSMTFVQAAAKSSTNFCFASSLA